MRFWDRAKAVVGDVLREVVDVPTAAAPSPPPRTVPVGWYGDQLLSDRERQDKWRRHLERQRHEAADEAEARRQAAEDLQQAIDRSPNKAYFPPPDPSSHTGLAGLVACINDMTRRS
jgi:hypothetical protein